MFISFLKMHPWLSPKGLYTIDTWQFNWNRFPFISWGKEIRPYLQLVWRSLSTQNEESMLPRASWVSLCWKMASSSSSKHVWTSFRVTCFSLIACAPTLTASATCFRKGTQVTTHSMKIGVYSIYTDDQLKQLTRPVAQRRPPVHKYFLSANC